MTDPDEDRDEQRESPFDDEDRQYDEGVDRIGAYLDAKAKLKTAMGQDEQRRLLHIIGDFAPRTPSEWAILKNMKKMRESKNG